MKVLITGGAGFIGCHLTRYLLSAGDEITILDNFSPQVHGADTGLPAGIAPHVRLIRGDVRNPRDIETAIQGQQALIHLAAETGTGQSMYEVTRYTEVNLHGTAHICQMLGRRQVSCLERLVVASSRAIYGEGAYECGAHGRSYPAHRDPVRLQRGEWEPVCPICEHPLTAVPTPEDAPLQPASYYGLTKQVQEQMLLMFGAGAGIPAFALRYQNVYGPGQSLQNPYTGILAIFSTLARSGRAIQVFEDGQESRDFVHVADVVRATAACLRTQHTGNLALNVGSGQRTTVIDVAQRIAAFHGGNSAVVVSQAWRGGDIRHGCADQTRALECLGFRPECDFGTGLKQFLEWACDQAILGGDFQQSLSELKAVGVFHESRQDRHRYGHV